MQEKPHGNKGNKNALGKGRTSKFGEKTTTVSGRVPISKKKDAQKVLDDYIKTLV